MPVVSLSRIRANLGSGSHGETDKSGSLDQELGSGVWKENHCQRRNQERYLSYEGHWK